MASEITTSTPNTGTWTKVSQELLPSNSTIAVLTPLEPPKEEQESIEHEPFIPSLQQLLLSTDNSNPTDTAVIMPDQAAVTLVSSSKRASPLPTDNQSGSYDSNSNSSSINSINSTAGGGGVQERRHRRRDGLRLHLDEIPLTDNDRTMQSLKRAKHAASLALNNHQPLYTVPQLSTKRRRDLTKLEWEFRNMMEHFANYSEADILSIADPRKRTLFEGIAASSYSRPVYRAFEILYEDLLPLRYAGRVIYNRLKEFMITSIQQRQEEMELILNTTGISKSIDIKSNNDDIQRISEIRLMFVTTASQLNSDSYLTLDQLADTGIITTTATEVLGFDTVDEVLQRLDKSSTGRITFVNLLLGLWELSNEYCGLELCNPQVVLHNLLVELNEQIHSSARPMMSTNDHLKLDENRQRHSLRYDEMVSSFIQWKNLLPPAPTHTPTGDDEEGVNEGGSVIATAMESRRMEIVRGCFAGAELPKVVDALRVVYVDYAALRVAGDIIYKLTATILKNRR